MQQLNIDTPTLNDTVNILKVLAHPIRYSIALCLVKNGELNVGSIQDALDLPQSTVSQHISKMRQVGVVTDKRDGTKIYYTLTNPIALKVVKSLI